MIRLFLFHLQICVEQHFQQMHIYLKNAGGVFQLTAAEVARICLYASTPSGRAS
jgi:hypothetical protein